MIRFVGAVAVALAAGVTAIVPDWIEEVFGVDPDGGSGALEWALVIGLAAVALVAAWFARSEWRRLRAPMGAE